MHLIFVLNTNFQGKPKKGYNIPGIRGETNMKKLHSLFILSILALTMFVGCQMPTDGTDSKLEAEETPSYTITVNATNGTVTLSKTEAKAGEKVFVESISANEGYTAIGMEQKFQSKDGNAITLDFGNENGKRYFVMPECNVVITVTFKATTPAVDADEATYGFVKTVNYTVVADGQSLPETKTGAELIALAKEKNLVKDTDYTIDGTTVSLTASGVEKYLGLYSLSVNASDGYAITGGGMKEAGKTVTLPITHYDGTDYVTPTATELYLVKVHIKEGETELNIEDVKVENNKITFTMPDKNINVFAEFCEIRYQTKKVDGYKARIWNLTDNEVTVVLCFDSKVYDNLEYREADGKYVLKVCDLKGHKIMYFTETEYGNYELSNDGTLDNKHYTFGVIDDNKLTILELFNNSHFPYESSN